MVLRLRCSAREDFKISSGCILSINQLESYNTELQFLTALFHDFPSYINARVFLVDLSLTFKVT
jgi:hypothetical protein